MYSILIIWRWTNRKNCASLHSSLGRAWFFHLWNSIKWSWGCSTDWKTSSGYHYHWPENAWNGRTGTNFVFWRKKEYPGEILVLSNYEDFDSVRSALLLGAADYLLKNQNSTRYTPCLSEQNHKKKMQNTADRKDSILKQTSLNP